MSSCEDTAPLKDAMLFSEHIASAVRRGPRVGELVLRGRNAISTPQFIGLTSRGVIPHLSHDMLESHTRIEGVYVALEDFIERGFDHSPLLPSPTSNSDQFSLRNFIALPDQQILILGPRRNPCVPCPTGSGDAGICINTSNGFRQLLSKEYVSAVKRLKPNIVVGLGDVRATAKASWRRTEKITSRTEQWTKDMIQAQMDETEKSSRDSASLFAPILPISNQLQSWYLDMLSTDFRTSLAGLAIYDVDGSFDLPEPLQSLPRLCLDNLQTPHKILHAISLGIDLLTIPFIGLATDAGIALQFTFPALRARNGVNARRPLGLDMWNADYAAQLSPLAPGCECYACKKHHRAFIQHLLSAKEMLAWVLLQIHNHHVIDVFFRGVRESITQGTFTADCHTFHEVYEPELPEKTGQGPRVRGYQHKSEGPGEPKKNAPAYRMLDEVAETLADAQVPSSNGQAENLEGQDHRER